MVWNTWPDFGAESSGSSVSAYYVHRKTKPNLFDRPKPEGPDARLRGGNKLPAGDTFALHAHDHAEVYFGLEGEGDVMIDGQPHRLAPGVALFIPGGAIHGVPLAAGPLTWFYTFAADGFSDIRYRFPDAKR
jgi:mannose-6-phosphate isomerase-like protein (cupin superfamily)